MSVKSSFDAQLGWVLRTVDDSVREYLLQIGFSDVSEHLRIAALGNNPVVPSTTTVAAPQDIWSGSGVYPLIPSARGLRVRSTSVEDGPAGTGAASVSANFLDGQYNVEAAVVTILNGITPVNIAGSHLRIQSALPVSKGAAAPYSATNVGDLIIEDQDAPNTVRAIIPAGYGFTRQAVFTVPTGYTAQVVSHVTGINRLSGGVQQFATIGLLFRNGVTVRLSNHFVLLFGNLCTPFGTCKLMGFIR